MTHIVLNIRTTAPRCGYTAVKGRKKTNMGSQPRFRIWRMMLSATANSMVRISEPTALTSRLPSFKSSHGKRRRTMLLAARINRNTAM